MLAALVRRRAGALGMSALRRHGPAGVHSVEAPGGLGVTGATACWCASNRRVTAYRWPLPAALLWQGPRYSLGMLPCQRPSCAGFAAAWACWRALAWPHAGALGVAEAAPRRRTRSGGGAVADTRPRWRSGGGGAMEAERRWRSCGGCGAVMPGTAGTLNT